VKPRSEDGAPRFHAFISYAASDSDLAANLRSRPADFGIGAWMYERDKLLGAVVWKEIERQLRASRVLLALISKDSDKSYGQKREFRMCVERIRRGKGAEFLVPALARRIRVFSASKDAEVVERRAARLLQHPVCVARLGSSVLSRSRRPALSSRVRVPATGMVAGGRKNRPVDRGKIRGRRPPVLPTTEPDGTLRVLFAEARSTSLDRPIEPAPDCT